MGARYTARASPERVLHFGTGSCFRLRGRAVPAPFHERENIEHRTSNAEHRMNAARHSRNAIVLVVLVMGDSKVFEDEDENEDEDEDEEERFARLEQTLIDSSAAREDSQPTIGN